jgi:hypothetical protein
MKSRNIVPTILLIATVTFQGEAAKAQWVQKKACPYAPARLKQDAQRKGVELHEPLLGGCSGPTEYSHILAEGEYFTEVTVCWWSAIDGIIFKTSNGKQWEIGQARGHGKKPWQNHTNSFTLKKGQYLKGVHATVGEQNGWVVIKDITFEFEGLTAQHFGMEAAKESLCPVEDGREIVGFWGWYGQLLDAVGGITRKRK